MIEHKVSGLLHFAYFTVLKIVFIIIYLKLLLLDNCYFDNQFTVSKLKL